MKSLKLNKINRNQLSAEQMNAVTGDASCTCSCYYAGQEGGSSTTDNGIANYEGGMNSIKGEAVMSIY